MVGHQVTEDVTEQKITEGICCNDLSFSWEKNPTNSDFIFQNVSLSIKKGEFVSFIGSSGCGKTTLLNVISGLLLPTTGSVQKDGQFVTEPQKDLGFVFQDYSLFPWLTVEKNVAFGLSLGNLSKADTETRITPILKRVGLWEARKKYPFQLSGGMRQRAAIARVLANNANYLLMDEPFGALDYQTRLNMQTFLAEISDEMNKTVLFVTHHVEEAIVLSDRVFLLSTPWQETPEELVIDLAKPREITGHQFNEYRKYIINHLNKTVNKNT